MTRKKQSKRYVYRDALTGRFVSRAYYDEKPVRTIRQRIKPCASKERGNG